MNPCKSPSSRTQTLDQEMETQKRQRAVSGQSIVEFAMVLPFMLTLVLGIIEVGYALYENHIIITMAREGSNLISRQSTLDEAETAIVAASAGPVNLSNDGKLIFSVVRLGTGGANLNQAIISQRHVVGTINANSILGNPPTSAYNSGPNYTVKNPDNDLSVRVSGPLPNGLTLTAGQSFYITEIYTTHEAITPFSKFGITLPTQLYASAYF
jgi:Flp pilus assembly protein TadG